MGNEGTKGRVLLLLAGVTALGIALGARAGAAEHRPHRDPACVRDCRADGRACTAPAREEIELCRDTTCAAEMQAADEACAADHDSETCRAARQAAGRCVKTCAESALSELRVCRNEVKGCVDGCPAPVDPRRKDRDCVAVCRAGLKGCISSLREEVAVCREPCQPLAEEAKEICAASPESEECRAARRALHGCLKPCKQLAREGVAACRSEARACIADCPDRAE